MKKLLLVVAGFGSILMLTMGQALAMQIQGPTGNQISGWYKDSFSLQIYHGTTTCSGSGTTYQYTYTAGSQYEGQHHYQFMSDQYDNPWLSVDNGPLQPLDMRCGTTTAGFIYTSGPSYDLQIDAQPPYAGIGSPSSGYTTTADTVDVTGMAGDSSSGLKSVQAIVNGTAGPFASLGGGGGSASGTSFSVTVSLVSGDNTIQMLATDNVGHTSTSAPITVTRQTSGGGGGTGGGGTTGGGSTTGGSTSSSSSTTTSSPSSTVTTSSGSPKTNTQPVKFAQQQVLNILDSSDSTSDPAQVQATASLAGATGKTYDALIATIIILFLLCAFVIWRFRPIFAELDRDKSGLRRRIIIIVTLPSLLPLLGLGFLGYQQLSTSVKNSLSGQLEKAAQTSSLKLDREFAIRRTVITKTASDILQIKTQFDQQQVQLSQQQTNCATVVKSDIPRGQYSQVTSNNDCLPFLTGFAQLASQSGAKVTDYLSALNEGAAQASQDLANQEDQRVAELLGSVRHYFPDILELDIVDATKTATIKATLPRVDSKQATLATAHAPLLQQAASNNLALLDDTGGVRQLILTYPVVSGQQTLGGVVVAFDTTDKNFVPSIWSSTPKPYAADQVYFVTTAGELVAPDNGSHQLTQQLASLSKNDPSKVYNMTLASQKLAVRTSPVSNTNWVVAVGAPASTILAPLAGIQRTAIMAIAGFILLSILLGIWFVSGIAGEVERLFKGALSFAKGDLDYRIDLSSHDELQVLGNTMNQMASDIKAAQTALVEKDKEFINVATHELKAPMTAIIGNLTMITEDGMGGVDEKARKLIDQAYQGTVRLRDIVTDMLDIARLESGHAEFKIEPIDIQSMTQTVIDLQNITAQQAGISIAYQAGAGLPAVLADKGKLLIILTNFVSNAIKYNRPNGSVTISHKLDGSNLITSVADTGLGIPADQQAHIFEKFYRVQHADRANVPGTGLGMHITKRFVEAMGGKVWFESVHGQGTTFNFSLPVEIPAPVAPNGATGALAIS